MKMSKIALAIVTAGVAATSNAATISGGALAGLDTNESGGAGVGVSAVAIIVQGDVHNALQKMQNLGAACIGNRNKLCAPSLSSSEVRGLLNNSWGAAGLVTGANGTLLSNYGDSTNYAGTVATKSAMLHGRATGNVDDALLQFAATGACGAGAPLEAANFAGADDASIVTTVSAGSVKGQVGFIHATELDDSNQDYGFVKLDGSAPDLLNLASSNYNLISNLHGVLPLADKATHGMTVGVSAAGGNGVAYHNFNSSFIACAPTDTAASVADGNGGGL